MDERQPELLRQQRVHQGRVIEVSVDHVLLPNGRTIDLDFVAHPGAAAIVAVTDDAHVLLVRQLRYATGEYLLEIPAGKLDPGERPEACAHRELEEEVGHRALQMTSMGSIWTTPGFCNERIWLYLARDLQRTQQALDDDEILTVERLPLADALQRAERGDISDAKSVCALLRARAYLGA